PWHGLSPRRQSTLTDAQAPAEGGPRRTTHTDFGTCSLCRAPAAVTLRGSLRSYLWVTEPTVARRDLRHIVFGILYKARRADDARGSHVLSRHHREDSTFPVSD